MKPQTIYIMIGVLVAVLIAYFVFFKDKATATVGAVALGKNTSGVPFYEADVLEVIKGIKGTPEWMANLTADAKSKGKDLNSFIRENAVFVLQTR